jgi:uncharacterized protein (DUF433 family)
MAFERIAIDHEIMGGVPCISGTRIPVTTVVAMIAEGMTTADVLDEFPQLTEDDLHDALRCRAPIFRSRSSERQI